MNILTIIIVFLVAFIISMVLLLGYVLDGIRELLSLSVLVLKSWEKNNDRI